ncbi:hypothetical protein D9615_010687 [Tricholomella constricta]|uniref:Uncharacterized protein n=1 Tax=Tricholomella constricta TaxID=117010 RepID=A0A8H5GK83_9AGAR|nr:hypothetical protein D9615_010688 [Tricholomella constricta]KAF5366620.1 hypothetical protein D9615_010687 [Tricholomella constricta]
MPFSPLSLRFNKARNTMHPIHQELLDEKKELSKGGGMFALERSATGGKESMAILCILSSSSPTSIVLNLFDDINVVSCKVKSNWEAERDECMPDDVIIANVGYVSLRLTFAFSSSFCPLPISPISARADLASPFCLQIRHTGHPRNVLGLPARAEPRAVRTARKPYPPSSAFGIGAKHLAPSLRVPRTSCHHTLLTSTPYNATQPVPVPAASPLLLEHPSCTRPAFTPYHPPVPFAASVAAPTIVTTTPGPVPLALLTDRSWAGPGPSSCTTSSITMYAISLSLGRATHSVLNDYYPILGRLSSVLDEPLSAATTAGMKVIQFFAWGILFLRLQEERDGVHPLPAAHNAVAMGMPVLASVIAFVIYSSTGHALKPGVISYSLTLFTLLSAIADAANATSLLYSIFEAELLTETIIVHTTLDAVMEVSKSSTTCLRWDPRLIWNPRLLQAVRSKSGPEAKLARYRENICFGQREVTRVALEVGTQGRQAKVEGVQRPWADLTQNVNVRNVLGIWQEITCVLLFSQAVSEHNGMGALTEQGPRAGSSWMLEGQRREESAHRAGRRWSCIHFGIVERAHLTDVKDRMRNCRQQETPPLTLTIPRLILPLKVPLPPTQHQHHHHPRGLASTSASASCAPAGPCLTPAAAVALPTSARPPPRLPSQSLPATYNIRNCKREIEGGHHTGRSHPIPIFIFAQASAKPLRSPSLMPSPPQVLGIQHPRHHHHQRLRPLENETPSRRLYGQCYDDKYTFMGLMDLYGVSLVSIHLLGKPAEADLKHPFKTAGMFNAAPTEPATDAASITEAEKRVGAKKEY